MKTIILSLLLCGVLVHTLPHNKLSARHDPDSKSKTDLKTKDKLLLPRVNNSSEENNNRTKKSATYCFEVQNSGSSQCCPCPSGIGSQGSNGVIYTNEGRQQIVYEGVQPVNPTFGITKVFSPQTVVTQKVIPSVAVSSQSETSICCHPCVTQSNNQEFILQPTDNHQKHYVQPPPVCQHHTTPPPAVYQPQFGQASGSSSNENLSRNNSSSETVVKNVESSKCDEDTYVVIPPVDTQSSVTYVQFPIIQQQTPVFPQILKGKSKLIDACMPKTNGSTKSIITKSESSSSSESASSGTSSFVSNAGGLSDFRPQLIEQFNQPGQLNQFGQFNQPGQFNLPGQFNQPGQLNQFVQFNQPGQVNQPGLVNQQGQFNQPGQVYQAGSVNQPGQVNQSGQVNQPGSANQPGQFNQLGQFNQEQLNQLGQFNQQQQFNQGQLSQPYDLPSPSVNHQQIYQPPQSNGFLINNQGFIIPSGALQSYENQLSVNPINQIGFGHQQAPQLNNHLFQQRSYNMPLPYPITPEMASPRSANDISQAQFNLVSFFLFLYIYFNNLFNVFVIFFIVPESTAEFESRSTGR